MVTPAMKGAGGGLSGASTGGRFTGPKNRFNLFLWTVMIVVRRDEWTPSRFMV